MLNVMPLESFSYCIPYVLVFFALLFLYQCEIGHVKGVSSKGASRLAFVILLFFIGLRGYLGTDFSQYVLAFEETSDIKSLNALDFIRFEPGFVLYTSAIKTIWNDYHFYVFISSLIDLLVFYYVFKCYTDSVVLSFLFFFTFQGLGLEVDLFRNVKGIDFFLLSIPFLQDRKFLPYLVLNVLGATFHVSSLVFIPCYFVLTHKFSVKTIVVVVVVGNILYLTHALSIANRLYSMILNITSSGIIAEKLLGHIDNATSGGFSLSHIQRTISVIIAIVFYDKLILQKQSNIVFINCLLLYYVLIMLFSEVSVLSGRFSLLFVVGEWVVLSNFFSLKHKYKKIVCALLLLLCLYQNVSKHKAILDRYDNVLFEITDYSTRVQYFTDYYYYRGWY